jgi:hypothetical protein
VVYPAGPPPVVIEGAWGPGYYHRPYYYRESRKTGILGGIALLAANRDLAPWFPRRRGRLTTCPALGGLRAYPL